MLGCARAPRRCAGEVPLGVDPAPALAPLRSAFLPFDALLVVVPISRWTTRDRRSTPILGRPSERQQLSSALFRPEPTVGEKRYPVL
jgi:hypothetical protein